MEFAADLGLFIAKIIAVLISLALVMAVVVLAMMRARMAGEDHLEVRNLNHKYQHMALMLKQALLPRKAFRQFLKQSREIRKKRRKRTGSRRVFVVEFQGDIRASRVASLREEISAILQVAGRDDEVVVLLESGGGTVHGYGLAASQLARVRDRGIQLTVAIDKLAASGGYMMACVANRIIAAPFAIVGSVGVLGQMPNFHRLLKRHDIDFEQIAAGEYKRSLTLFGENTDADRARFREEVETTHALFKEFVKRNRPQLDIERIATGEHWYGSRALELKLVDALQTSDDYLMQTADSADVLQVSYVRRKPLLEKLLGPKLQQMMDERLPG